jgi:D-psicose/D-tagatose/L-ribulose 3-epimerase
MNIAVSNIAWTANEEPDVAKALQELGIHHVEIAPTKVWDDPTNVSDADIQKYKDFWAKYDIEVVAFQSMLFGRTDLTLFDDEETRAKTADYLKKFIELAGRMGAEVLVFGSPKNRIVPESMTQEEAWQVAKTFFADLGNHAITNQTNFCIEPNAKEYECNFVNTAAEGLKLVDETDNLGFELHLDAAIMAMENDDPQASIENAREHLRHFHISAPFLQPIEEEKVPHKAFAGALRGINYQHYTSIEMRPGDEGTNVERVQNAVKIAQKYYS